MDRDSSIRDFLNSLKIDEVERAGRALMRDKALRRLEASIPGLKIDSYEGLLPVQAEGTLHSMPFYFRQRSGPATLSLSGPNSENRYDFRGVLYEAAQDGEADTARVETFVEVFRDLVARLSRAEYSWTYEGAEVLDHDGELIRTGRLVSFTATALDSEQARALITAPDAEEDVDSVPYRQIRKLFTKTKVPSGHSYQSYWDLVSLTDKPLNSDTRVYPSPEPNFTVLPLGN